MNAALLGAGEPHFHAHLQTLRVLPEIDTIYIWGDDADAMAALRADTPEKVGGLFDDLDELLAQDVFFAIATMRSDLKPAIFDRLLHAGIHLMGEKPIASTAAEVATLVETAESRNLVLGTCYQNRYHPMVRDVRALIAQDLVGPLMSIEMRMLTTQPMFRKPESWLFSQSEAGGGMLAWLGCHYIDMMRYISGDEIVSVAAEVATRSGETIDVEDVAVLSLRFRSGAIGSLHTGYTLALKGEQYGDTPSYDTYVGVNGRGGRIYWNDASEPGRLYVESTHSSWAAAPRREYDLAVAKSPAYGGIHGEAFIRDFIAAARGEGDIPASGRDALQVARVIDAAYESSRTGRRVDIEAPSANP